MVESISHNSGRRSLKERRDEKRRWRREALDANRLTHFERLPMTGFHLLLLGGLIEPYLYPSLVPLMLLMSHLAHDSDGVEGHARDAFNLTFFFSIVYGAVTVVCLATDRITDPYQVTILHAPIMIFYGLLVCLAVRRVYRGELHRYPMWFRLLRANGERSFMSNG